MRQIIWWIVLSALASMGLLAQRLETQPSDTSKVVRVETAADHLTVIELGDPVTMVAVGNQGAFTVERRQNRVFVKPVEDGANTNLFVWTTAGRFAYELVPAPSVEQMHFVIDQAPTAVAANGTPPTTVEADPETVSLPVEMLTKASPILLAGDRETHGRVEIALRDLYRERNRLYLRYAVLNHSSGDYLPSRPAAWHLSGVRSPQSLVPLRGRQLGERLARSLRAATVLRLETLEANDLPPIAAGDQALGWLVVNAPEDIAGGTAVLRLQFAAEAKGPVQAVLVLPASRYRQEVANARPAGK